MSSDFEKVLVLDDRLGAITDKISYAVTQGGQNITSASFKAISETPQAQIYNIQVPSLETILDRRVLWSSRVTLKVSMGAMGRGTAADKSGISANEFLVNYGVTDALAAFPLHSLVNTMSATINNNTVTTNMQDVLPLLLRMLDPEELAKYEGHTPTTLDYLASYKDGCDRMDFILGTAGAADTIRPVVYTPANAEADLSGNTRVFGTKTQKFISYPNNVLGFDQNRIAGSSHNHKPRGTWSINRIYGKDSAGLIQAVLLADEDVYVEFDVCEPLLLSPFTLGQPDHPGFYGISNLTFNLT